jgi:hypothetical protein
MEQVLDALLDAKPSAPSRIATLRLRTSFPSVQRAEGLVVITTLVLLAVFMVVCLVGVAIIPRFDRPAPIAQRAEVNAPGTRPDPSALR